MKEAINCRLGFQFKIIVAVTLLFCCTSSKITIGKSELPKPMLKNAVYPTGGNLFIWVEASLNLERILAQNENGTNAFGSSLGFGYCAAAFEDEGFFFNPKFFVLAGKKAHKFFEFSFGANIFPDEKMAKNVEVFTPYMGFGYRKHVFNGRGVFRIGGAWPSGLCGSFGLRF